MKETDQFVKIGQVLKSNGTEGQVIIRLYDVAPDADQIEREPVYVFFDGLPVPFFISDVQEKGSGKIIAGLTDVKSLDDAEEIAGRYLFLPVGSVASSSDDACGNVADMDLTGWRVYEAPATLLGTVTALEDIPGNPCIEVELSANREKILLPLHEDFILECDPQNKTLVMSLPEGLV